MNRQQAADYLGVSTRTVDRYVKKWTLSYKKVANKVLLSEEDLAKVKKELDLLHQPALQTARESSSKSEQNKTESNAIGSIDDGDYVHAIAEFASIITQKDQTIEEKNQLIYMLQRKIWEVETQMSSMIALPHHNQEKEELSQQLEELEQFSDKLQSQVRKEKLLNVICLCLIILAAIVLWVLFLQ